MSQGLQLLSGLLDKGVDSRTNLESNKDGMGIAHKSNSGTSLLRNALAAAMKEEKREGRKWPTPYLDRLDCVLDLVQPALRTPRRCITVCHSVSSLQQPRTYTIHITEHGDDG
jgi:hypothetical protein